MKPADYARLAADAYTAPPTWVVGDVYARLTEDLDGPIVAFKGTSPDCLADWLRDLDIFPERSPLIGWCHKGFLDGATAALGGVLQAARGRPLRLVGHSLGGALAALTGALADASGQPVLEVVTFGCPKVSFGPHRLLPKVSVVQYRHACDPVPLVPPGYQPVRDWIQLPGVQAPEPIGDHAIARYIAALAAQETP